MHVFRASQNFNNLIKYYNCYVFSFEAGVVSPPTVKPESGCYIMDINSKGTACRFGDAENNALYDSI